VKRKILLIYLFLISFSLPVFSEPIVETSFPSFDSKPIECEVTFDWISKTQIQRDENIKQIQDVLFSDKTTVKYSKKEFREMYKTFWRDKDYLNTYETVSSGKKEDEQKYYCGFFIKKLLIAYGFQYKNNMKNIYYYDAMGHLRWVDVFSPEYPKFPYWSYQYYRNGELVAAYYYVSNYDQYVFSPDKKFKGRWYKEKMYNKNAKVIMTRSNWQ